MKRILGVIWFIILALIVLILVLLTLISDLFPNKVQKKCSDILTNFSTKINDLDKKLSKYYE